MPAIRHNGLTGQLGYTLSSSDTTLVFSSPPLHSGSAEEPLAAIEAPDYLILSLFNNGNLREIVHVTAYDPGVDPLSATIERAQEGTVAVEHPAGTRWMNALTVEEANILQSLSFYRGDWNPPNENILWSTDFEDPADIAYFTVVRSIGSLPTTFSREPVSTQFTGEAGAEYCISVRTANSGSNGYAGLSFNYAAVLDPGVTPYRYKAKIAATAWGGGFTRSLRLNDVVFSASTPAIPWLEASALHSGISGLTVNQHTTGNGDVRSANAGMTLFRVFGEPDPGDLYQLNDVVSHNNQYWISHFNNNTEEPGTGSRWKAITTGPVPYPQSGTISIGSVTTGAPGTPVAVQNAGNPQNVVLDFTIPRGYPGIGSTYDRRWAIGPGETSIDEFNDGVIDPAWTVAAHASIPALPSLARPRYTEQADVLSVKYGPETGTGQGVGEGGTGWHHGLIRPLSGAGGPMSNGDGFVSASMIALRGNSSYRMWGLVLSTTGTSGTGQQLYARLLSLIHI